MQHSDNGFAQRNLRALWIPSCLGGAVTYVPGVSAESGAADGTNKEVLKHLAKAKARGKTSVDLLGDAFRTSSCEGRRTAKKANR